MSQFKVDRHAISTPKTFQICHNFLVQILHIVGSVKIKLLIMSCFPLNSIFILGNCTPYNCGYWFID